MNPTPEFAHYSGNQEVFNFSSGSLQVDVELIVDDAHQKVPDNYSTPPFTRFIIIHGLMGKFILIVTFYHKKNTNVNYIMTVGCCY